MSRVRVLGDHTQSKTTILFIGFLNIILALLVPFIALFTSVTAIKRGFSHGEPLKYCINILALVISVIQMIIMPIILADIADGSDEKPLVIEQKATFSDLQIRPDYLEDSKSKISIAGEVEGVIDKSFEEAFDGIKKNIEQSKIFYEDESFTVNVSQSNVSGSIAKYIYNKNHPEYILFVDVINSSNILLKKDEIDLFQEKILTDNVFEKGSVVVSKNSKNENVNDVFIAVQGKNVAYGLMYQTDESVNYAMQKLHQIIINNTDSMITTYDFKPSTEEENLLYANEYKIFPLQ